MVMEGFGSKVNGAAEENVPERPFLRYEKCIPCPCGAGSCRLLTSTKKFSGRDFYKCPLPASEQCKFFKWADSVEPHDFIDVPHCGGCMAGVCRFTRVKSGPNAGRILFTCKIKEGQGSCGFKVWKDELHMCNGGQKIEISSKLSSIYYNNSGPANTELVEELKLYDDEPETEPRTGGTLQDEKVNEPHSSGTLHDETMYERMKPLKRQEYKSDESPRKPSKESWNGNIKGLSPPLNPIFVAQEETTVTESYSHHPLFTQGCNSESSGSKRSCVTLDVPLGSKILSETTRLDNVMNETISKSFKLAAEHLQNDLLARLEAMDFKDHQVMAQAAEATFSALDRLFSDHQPLKDHVKELIHCAMSLTEIEQSVPNKDSYQKMIHRCYNERMKLDEMDHAHAQVVEYVSRSRELVKVLQREVSSAKNWLSQAEADLSGCKMDMKNLELQLEQITKDKEILRRNFVVASKRWEDAWKLVEQREGERNAATAAFDKAREFL